MSGKQQHNRVIQIATILSYQTGAMGVMLLAASFLTDMSATGQPVVETAAAVECSRTVSAPQAAPQVAASDFLDLTVAWLLH